MIFRRNSRKPKRSANEILESLRGQVPDVGDGLFARIALGEGGRLKNFTDAAIPNTVNVHIERDTETTPVKFDKLMPGIAKLLTDDIAVRLKIGEDGNYWIIGPDRYESDRAYRSTVPPTNLQLDRHDHTDDRNGGPIPTTALRGTIPVYQGGTGLSDPEPHSIIYPIGEAVLGQLKPAENETGVKLLGWLDGILGFFDQVMSALKVGTVEEVVEIAPTPELTVTDLGENKISLGVGATLSNKTLVTPSISGGTINNATIGATTPAAAAVTMLRTTGAAGIGASPHASAQMHVVSTTRGSIAYPVMTSAQRLAIVSPAAGLGVYDSDEAALYLWDGTAWQPVGSGGPIAFTDLTDTFPSYAGLGGKALRVKTDGTGIEAADSGDSDIDLTDGTTTVTGASVLEFAGGTLADAGGGRGIYTPPSGGGGGGGQVTKTSIRTETLLSRTDFATAGTFSYTLPAGYDHIVLRGSIRVTVSGEIFWRANNQPNNAATYTWQALVGREGAVTTPETVTNQLAGGTAGSTSAPNVFTTFEMTLPDYANTTKIKQAIWSSRNQTQIGSTTGSAAAYVAENLSAFKSTDPISSIDFRTNTDTLISFDVGSYIEVWGVKTTDVVTDAGLVAYSSVDFSTPPTAAELDAAFGSPAEMGQGYAAVADKDGAGTSVHLAVSNGSKWFIAPMTEAV